MDTVKLFEAELDAALTQNAFHGDPMDALSKQIESMGDDLWLDDELIDLEY